MGRMTAIDYSIHVVQIMIGLILWMWLTGTDVGAIFAKVTAIF